jgi:transposase
MTHGGQYQQAPWIEDDEDPREALQATFQRRVACGRYDELLNPEVRALIQTGAGIRGLDEELGAIRYALQKLIAEEPDAGRLAAGIARLTSASVQVMKLGQALGDATDASLSDLLNEILADLDDSETRDPLS